MTKKSADPPAPKRTLSSWDEIAKCLGEFPAPKTSMYSDPYDGIRKGVEEWAFRGLQSSIYKLQPTIEREVKYRSMGWSALEALVSPEFKARARMIFR